MNDLAVAVGVGAVAAVLGIPVGRWLEATTYRKPDEDDVPHPGRRWWVPLVLGLVSALTVHRIWFVEDDAVPGWPVALVLTATALLVILSCVCLAAMDLDVHRLPDRIMWPTMGFLGAGVTLAALVGGGFDPWLRSVLAAVASGGFYLVLALVSLARGSLALGLGDVKLAVVLGGALGWYGWTETVAGIYAGFLVGGLVAIGLLVARRVSWRGDFAYGPPMMVGALLGLLLVPQAVGGLL